MTKTENKNNFWRNFTWKRFILATLFWFALTLVMDEILDYDHWQIFFTTSSLLHSVFRSLVFGLVITIWGWGRGKKNLGPTFDV
jgi:membrane protein required for beta-lactamase induction